MSPLEMDLGFNPKTRLEMISGSFALDSIESIKDFKQRLKSSLESAIFFASNCEGKTERSFS